VLALPNDRILKAEIRKKDSPGHHVLVLFHEDQPIVAGLELFRRKNAVVAPVDLQPSRQLIVVAQSLRKIQTQTSFRISQHLRRQTVRCIQGPVQVRPQDLLENRLPAAHAHVRTTRTASLLSIAWTSNE